MREPTCCELLTVRGIFADRAAYLADPD